MPPDVSTLSLKLKAESLTSGPPPSSCCCCEKMATVQCVPRIYSARFGLKNVKRFMFMKFFDDTAMFLHGQRISSISTDTLDTDEISMINEEFLNFNHARVSYSCPLCPDTREEKNSQNLSKPGVSDSLTQFSNVMRSCGVG